MHIFLDTTILGKLPTSNPAAAKTVAAATTAAAATAAATQTTTAGRG